MADRSVVVRLRAIVTDYEQGFRKASQTASTALSRNTSEARELTTQVGLVGLGLTGMAAVAVKKFADFDKAMSSVQASTRATGGELESLRQAAIKAGADTAFSASEAAQGIDELAKAGVSTKDILGGGLTGALDLAAAGQLDVASAAETAASAMTQFKLEGSQVGHIADLLAAGAGKAQGSVHDMGEALNQAGLVASQTGLTIEEATGGLAAFASAGLVGSDAGTSFKTMLQALNPSSKEAATLMEELGISAYDSQGNFIGLANFAGVLREGLSGLSVEQQNAAMKTIFGTDAVRAAAVMYEQGAEGVQGWIDKVNDSGYAAETARIQTDNLAGDLERLGGAVDTALIQSGSGANDLLRNVVQSAEAVVDAIGRIPGPILSTLTMITGAGGLALAGAAGVGKLAISFTEARDAAKALGISTRTAAIAAGGVGVALAAGTVILTAWADKAAETKARIEGIKTTLDDFGNTTESTIRRINTTLSAPNEVSFWDKIFGPPKAHDTRSAFEMADRLKIAHEDVTAAILGQADARDRVNAAIDDALSKDSVWDTDTRSAAATLTGIIDEQTSAIQTSTTEKEREAAANEALGAAEEELAEDTAETTGAIVDQIEALEKQYEALMKAAGLVLSERDAQRSYEEALDSATEALKANGETLDATTEKGRANQEALDGIASSALDYAQSMFDAGRSTEDVQAYIGSAREQFLAMAESMGMSTEDANALADQLQLIPGEYTADIAADTTQAQEALATLLEQIASASGTITIEGDPTSGEQTLHGLTAQVDASAGTVTILGADGKARTTLSDYTYTVNESDGTVTIKGNDSRGRATTASLTNWIDSQGASVKVNANTENAFKALNYFRSEAQKSITTTVNGRTVIDFTALGKGDGEGMYTGGTPRGVAAMSSAVRQMDPSARITSGYRPGAKTATGFTSYHALGRAIDIVSPNMGRTFDMLRAAFGPRIKELYYTPRGFIRNGRPTTDVAPVTRRTHRDHVHLALNQGGLVPGTPPANPREDNLLAFTEQGRPLLVRSKEYVQPQPTVDYYGVGVMEALRQRRIPKGALQGYADGGFVGGSSVPQSTGYAAPAASGMAVQQVNVVAPSLTGVQVVLDIDGRKITGVMREVARAEAGDVVAGARRASDATRSTRGRRE